ncbi:MAG: PP2C family protein-serine/threonine phosphatase, partial [Micromonosporaceae bacterium]
DPVVTATHDYQVAGVRLSVTGGTSVGRRYRANFDVLHISDVPPLALVADGMGDGQGSAAAGRIATEVFVEEVTSRGGELDPRTLRAAVASAQQRVTAAGAALGELTGATLTSFVVDQAGAAWIVHIGDSRAYRRRGRVLELLTVDHTAAWLGAIYGWYPIDSAAAAAARYQLHRYVGHPGQPEPDVLNVSLRPGDRYLLCTDGLAEQVSYQRLDQLLGQLPQLSADEVVRQSLHDALAAGGHDNATVALITVDPGEA